MHVKNLECSYCHREYEARRVHNVCTECGKPLFVRYDLKRIAKFLTRQTLYARRADLWRYREVLPVRREDNIVSLGEGWTPLHHAKNLGASLGMTELFVKDESLEAVCRQIKSFLLPIVQALASDERFQRQWPAGGLWE